MKRYKNFGAEELFEVTSNDLGEGPVIALLQGRGEVLLVTLDSSKKAVYWKLFVSAGKLQLEKTPYWSIREEVGSE